MRGAARKLCVAAGLAFTGLGMISSASVPAAAAAPLQALHVGTAAPIPRGTRPLGTLSPRTRIALDVALRPRSAPALAAYAREVSTPGSRLFHRYLTVREFRRRFAPSARTVRGVEAALRARGLRPRLISPDGLLISVNAHAGTLAHALDTHFERVRLSGGRSAYTNTRAPLLPARVARSVQAVAGLDSLPLAAPTSLVRAAGSQHDKAGAATAAAVLGAQPHAASAGPTACAAASQTATAAGAYTAGEIASTYGFDGFYAAGDEGAGQTIGLFELEPNLSSDITAYQTCYGTGATVRYTPVDGGPGQPGTAGSGEAALDIEQVVGLAPRAEIDVFQGPNDGGTGYIDTLTQMVDDPQLTVISTSWGLCEQDAGALAQTEATLFEQAATEGISVFAAAGDDGSSDCLQDGSSGTSLAPDALAVDDPASDPYVTAVGGTSLPALAGTPPTAGDALAQTVWNDSADSDGAGGGGISALWQMPRWQLDAPPALNVINVNSSGLPCGASSGYCRELPDVSADADPNTGYAIYYNGGWIVVGGTSAAAPLWAAYTALVNASALCNGRPVGFASPLLYQAASSSAYSADFTDIAASSGGSPQDNDYEPTNYTGALYTGGLYPAAGGYDMATGLGTPNGGPLGRSLCEQSDVVSLSAPNAQSSLLGQAVTPVTPVSSDTERHALTFSASGLPPGLEIDQGTGMISGTPSSTGAYTITLSALSPLTGASAQARFDWTVSLPPPDVQPNAPSAFGQPPTEPAPTSQPTPPATSSGQTTTSGPTTSSGQTTSSGPTTTSGSTTTPNGSTTPRRPTVPRKSTVTRKPRPAPAATPRRGLHRAASVSVVFDGRTLVLKASQPGACVAPGRALNVSFRVRHAHGSARGRVRFGSVAFYLGRGLERRTHERVRRDGRLRQITVATHVPNAVSRRADVSARLRVRQLSRGRRTLRAHVRFVAEPRRGHRGLTQTLERTLRLRFAVC